MGYLADIYIIKRSRSKDLAISFLNHFLPNREESTDEYWVPQYSEHPTHQFDEVDELMTFMEENEGYAMSVYWRSTDEENPNKHGMVFYNKDGTMVFGISRLADMSGNLNTDNEEECLSEMKEFFNTDLGYIHYENPPVDSYQEFVEIVNELKKDRE